MTEKTANVVMDYIEPMKDGGGEVIRSAFWYAISLYFNAPLGREYADSLADTINESDTAGRKAMVLTLPADEASALGHKWITETEMTKLVELSDKTEGQMQ